MLRREGTALLFGYAAAVAASASWVHFDGGVGDTLRPCERLEYDFISENGMHAPLGALWTRKPSLPA